MRRQSQLADLISGSGLVKGLERRSASQDGQSGPSQPVLYHFGGRGSTSAKEHRDRPPLPMHPVNGASSNSNSAGTSGPGRPPPGPAWSSPQAIPGAASFGDGGGSGAVSNSSNRSAEAPLLHDTVSAPLPQLSLQRNSLGPEGVEVAGSASSSLTSAYLSSGFLPAVSGGGGTSSASDQGASLDQQPLQPGQLSYQPPLGSSSQHGSGGTSHVMQPDPRVGGAGSSGGGGSSGGHGSAPLRSSSPNFQGSLSGSVSPAPDVYGGFGSAVDIGGAGAWQQHKRATSTDAATTGGGGASQRNATQGSGSNAGGGRNAHSGGRAKAYGGGGGGFNAMRWGRPNSTSRAGDFSSMQRSSSDSSVRTSGDAAGVALAMSVQGAWSNVDGGVSSPGEGPSSVRTSFASGTGGVGGGGGGSGSRPGRPSPLVQGGGVGPGGAELLVVEEESSSAELSTGRGSPKTSGVSAGADSHWSMTLLPHGPAAAETVPRLDTAISAATSTISAVVAATASAGVGGDGGSGLVPGPIPAFAAPAAGGSADEVQELRRMVAELSAHVTRLTAQLRDSELSAAQLQSMAAAAVASEREAAEMEVARRHMKALKSAEASRDKAEVARRGAEKRARVAEEELAAVKEKLEAKTKQAANLEASLADAQAALDRQRKAQEEAVEALEAQHKAQARKASLDADTEKKALQENISKMQESVAKRNQTVLALQADLEAANLASSRKDEQLAEMQAAMARMATDLERERNRRRAEAETEAAAAAAAATRMLELRTEEFPGTSGSPAGRQGQPRPEATDGSALNAIVNAAAVAASVSASAAATSPLGGASRRGAALSVASSYRPASSSSVAPSVAAASIAGGGGGAAAVAGGGPLMDDQSRAIRKLQSEVSAIREDHAKRLVELDDVVSASEATMRDGIQGLERMFNVLVSRVAGILLGRLGSFKVPPGGRTPPRPGTPTSARAAAAAAANGANNAVLHMNERLAAENAQLLAELTRWQSGRHAMLRKLNMTVLGADPPPPPPPPPLTHQQKIAQAIAAVTGGGGSNHGSSTNSSPPPAAAAAAASTPPPPQQPHGPKQFMYQQNFSAPPGGYANNLGADLGASGPMTPAREALAAATRDALLAGRKELLPAVMTAEGWGGSAVQNGGWDTNAAAQQLHGGKVEAALAAAESSLRLRTQLLALQAEVTRNRASGGEVVERGRETAALQETHEAEMAEARRELTAAKHQMSHLQRELERARAGIPNTGPAAGGLDPVERDRLEEAATTARDDAARHKAVASAARRDLEARERQLEEAQLRVERLEMQCREARSEAQRNSEGVKRLRVLLAQAKQLLREQGVSFMEDDPGLDQLLATANGQGGGAGGGGPGGGGGKGGKQQKQGASGADSDGPLFKALDAREREKELQRLQSDVLDLQTQVATANKELKKVRKQMAAQQEAAQQEQRDQRLQLAGTIDTLARDAEAAKDSCRALQKQLQDAKHEAGELRRQIADLNDKLTRARLDADYLRARAAAGKMKPKLSHAKALSISISAATASPQPEG